jgi:hypothetical protein
MVTKRYSDVLELASSCAKLGSERYFECELKVTRRDSGEIYPRFTPKYRSGTHDARSHMMHDFPKVNHGILLPITQPHRRLRV